MEEPWLTRMALDQLAFIFAVTVGGTLAVFFGIEAVRFPRSVARAAARAA